MVVEFDREIDRYKKEKNELLMGSAMVGKENWVQDIDGEFGKVVGAKEWENKVETLGRAGDIFDMGVLFLQLSLVIGAISLVLDRPVMKRTFYAGMVLLGSIGSVYAARAFAVALSV